MFCPDDFVTRGQMAASLNRALDLVPIEAVVPASNVEGYSPTSRGPILPVGRSSTEDGEPAETDRSGH